MARVLEKKTEIERSIIKKYRKTIWNGFVASVQEYELIQPNDRIAVCISGGKDSMLLAKCMQQLQRHSDFPFELEFVVMDPGYAEPNRKLLQENLNKLGIEATIFENSIFDVAYNAGGSPCYLCARMRRGALYDRARQLGCNKIALGHHQDDVIETLLMSMMYASEIKTMLPKLHSTNFEGMELIRPLYRVKERDIISWANYNDLHFLQCACRFTADSAFDESLSKRKETKMLIAELRKTNPNVDDNIFRSLHNVNLATIPGWRDRDCGDTHSFLETYYETKNKNMEKTDENR
ncbi:MAG: tRNA 2-thiocytidine biosynthesis protein TtcA [Clostridia bacterium]|nr:tRNA 2-thiocytidine biosynthesis protein TtcA [Clostridia bacterium]